MVWPLRCSTGHIRRNTFPSSYTHLRMSVDRSGETTDYSCKLNNTGTLPGRKEERGYLRQEFRRRWSHQDNFVIPSRIVWRQVLFCYQRKGGSLVDSELLPVFSEVRRLRLVKEIEDGGETRDRGRGGWGMTKGTNKTVGSRMGPIKVTDNRGRP